MIRYIFIIALLLPEVMWAQQASLKGSVKQSQDGIPTDPKVRTGVLPNGFQYYIRKNGEPQKRVVFYLVNKVGSILETDEQRGLAHFMEHMNFNGTKHYPENELVDYLQKAGVRFGADVNAYTGYEETVYQLPLSTDDPAMVSKGMDIMRDWAQEATLDSLEIEKERGVVLEEKRLGAGVSERISRQYMPVLLNHSRYSGRMPIGTEAVLTEFKPHMLRQFHHDWYRPDLQALIVVGDIDIEQAEKMIRAKFSDLKNPVDEKPRPHYEVPLPGAGHFLVVTDHEIPAASLEILFKHRAPALATKSDYISSMKRTLLNQLLGARFYAERNNNSEPAYQAAGAGIQPFIGKVDMLAFTVRAREGRLQESVEQSWKVIEQAKRYGFTQSELNRAVNEYLSGLERAVREKDKTSSEYYVQQYQALFLRGDAAPDIEWEYAFCREQLPLITLNDINGLLTEYLQSPDRDILITASDREQVSLPDSLTAMQWIERVRSMPLSAYQDETVAQSLITAMPPKGKVTQKQFISLIGVTVLTLSNGIKVLLKPTTFKNDEIQFTGFRPGGTSSYGPADYDVAANAASLINRFGAGTFNPIQLSKILSGKSVKVTTDINQRYAVINGASSLINLESALQLTYLQLTAPRIDSLLYANAVGNLKESLKYRYSDPGAVFQDTINYVLGNYNFRFAPPTVERLNALSPQKILEVYKSGFADAAGFTYVFVGSFTIDSIVPLLETYLGALPSSHKQVHSVTGKNKDVAIPAGQFTKKVFKGTENKATVRLVASGSYQFGVANNLLVRALGEILQIRLIERLREQEGEVYSPRAQVSYEKYPVSHYVFTISFGCAPQNVDHLIALVEQEFASLRKNGPLESDVQKFKAGYRKTLELSLKNNPFWLGYLVTQKQQGEDILQILNSEKNLEQVNVRTLRGAAQLYLKGENLIRFELLPETVNH